MNGVGIYSVEVLTIIQGVALGIITVLRRVYTEYSVVGIIWTTF